MGGYAWVTLATNDAYSLGALVLAHSLRRVGTKYELAVLITPGVTQTMREKLSAVFSLVMEVNVLDSKDEANLALLARPELGITFTKLHCWRLTQYKKCVFLDADTLVVRNCDELFEREELSAAPDVGWPDCFNSGVFVYRPSQQTFASITAFAAAKGSFDGGDQGLLNMYFSDWARKDISKHLPFIYNMCSTATYSYLPAFKQFGDDVRIIHFIGITKPWLQYFDTLTGIVQPPMGTAHLQPLLQLWWNIFCEKVHPQLSPVMATSTLAPIWHEFSPIPYESSIPRSPVYTDIQDKAQNDIYLEPPDFTEFQDPWENYCVQNDPVIYKAEDNQPQQYYSTFNSSPPVSMLNDQFNYLKSIHQTHYEAPTEHSREFHHKQHHNESNPPSCVQHHHNQEQFNQFIDKNEQQHSFFHSEDIPSSIVQINHWQNQHSIENCIPVHNVQSHHSNESQHQYVDYQYTPQNSYNDNNRLVSENIKQNQHVVYQHTTHQHSSNGSNKSLSEVTKQHQHNEPYINHQCNHYQMYDNVYNKQLTQHYEHKNQTFQFNEQVELKFRKQESLNVNIDHNQTVQNNVAYQDNLPIKQSTDQNDNVNITDERTNALISTSPHPESKPCTDIHIVATQSDPHIMDDLNSSNGGLAGALAQMTLGEPRSAEQIALEEHMRKQSWEQGHIDYMGRDSFDNIWKKICETLALAPPRLPSPPKETEKSAKTTTDKTEEPVESSEPTQSLESIDEVDKGTAQATTSHTEEQSLVNNVPITNVPKLSEKNEQDIDATSSTKKSVDDVPQKFSTKSESELVDTFVDSSPTNISIQTSDKKVAELYSSSLLKEAPSRQTAVPIVSSDLVQSCSIGEQKAISSMKELESGIRNIDLKLTIDTPETKQPDIRDEKYAKELSTASEILTVSPVPIQVAESVLQVEPKESVSDSQVIQQEVLSSTITPVHLTEAEDKVHINGSTLSIDSMQSKEKLCLNNTSPVKSIDTANKLSELPTKSEEHSQTLLPIEQTQSQLVETPILPLSISQYLAATGDWAEKQITESGQKSKESGSCMEGTVQPIETSVECEEAKTLPSSKTPVRPSRTKELSTPSTSVPKTAQQDIKSQEKATKKSVKKSTEKLVSEGEPTETTDGESTGKKVTKKVVKKVTKKPKTKSEEGLDDGAEDNSSAIKQKKTAKVIKKGTKPLQTPGTDTSVPENPSSSTSDAPTPPKRKTKTATAKTITKKSDVEQ